jgi:hypothetical protein
MWLRLTQANQSGKEVGPAVVNTDAIEFVRVELGVTAIELVSGHTRWVMETLEQIEAHIKRAREAGTP